MTHLRRTLLHRLICVFSLLFVSVSFSQIFPPSVQLAQNLLASISTSACPPEPITEALQKRTEEGTLARLPPLPKIHHVKSSQQRNTAHETHIMVFLKTPQNKHDSFSPLQILLQNQPPALVSFCRGKKSSTQECSHNDKPGFSSGKRKEASVTQQTEKKLTLPAAQWTNQSQTDNGNNITRVWSGHLQGISCKSAVQRLSPHLRVLSLAFVGQPRAGFRSQPGFPMKLSENCFLDKFCTSVATCVEKNFWVQRQLPSFCFRKS